MFGKDDLIFSYTRAQAIDDGVLVDLGALAREAGFRCPFAVTAAVWTDCCEWRDEDEAMKPFGQSWEGRSWDVVWKARCAAMGAHDGNQTAFEVFRIPREGDSVEAVAVRLVLHIGPGDNGEAVATVMFPDED